MNMFLQPVASRRATTRLPRKPAPPVTAMRLSASQLRMPIKTLPSVWHSIPCPLARRSAARNHVIVRLRGLHHQVHGAHIIAGVTPVAARLEVAEIKPLLQSHLDAGCGAGDLARHKGLAAARAFVVKQYAVACEQPVGFA